MTGDAPQPQITVLDAGGQYCHLIARRVRELGVYAEVQPSDTPSSELTGRKGIIISGGPSSVYEAGAPTVDPAIFTLGSAILGICYGQQLMAHLLEGKVRKGDKGEYGHAVAAITSSAPLFQGLDAREPVWMSHRDAVETPPSGFDVIASTETCRVAAIGEVARRMYGVQFHPEVAHTPHGQRILENFVLRICGCTVDWDPRGRIGLLEQHIRETTGNRNIFFFVSGGVDSSVAYRLCRDALGPGRVHGAYVDTGFMREGETEFVQAALDVEVVDARAEFLAGLQGVADPEQKRKFIGEQFVAVQERVLQSGHYLDGDWILGQGTIYPDTIESGGTVKADLIKTHHNRVAGIQKLIDEKRIIEPLSSFYKDEVREVGAELGLPDELLHRHPFPGPGLAIRLLCAAETAPVERWEDAWVIPIRSVGVQGDSRTYRPVLALEPDSWSEHLLHRATEMINRNAHVNRAVAVAGAHADLDAMSVRAAAIEPARINRLRQADAAVRRISHARGFDAKVWQFPVVVIPCGEGLRPDSVVLRPIHSVDGMTAQAVLPDRDLLGEMTQALLAIEGVCAVFFDLTHKPPATIEWE
jgi:GMP synthase (glutamine-hydrolysing)